MDEKNKIKILRDLVSFNSVFLNEKNIIGYCTGFLRSCGYNVTLQKVEENRYNVLATKGKGKKAIGLYGHLDTVSVYGKWTTNPFKLKEKENKLIGLGAWDMKAGCTAILYSALKFNPKNTKIKIAFGIDEENISKGACKIIESGFFSDCDLLLVPEIEDSNENKNPSLILGRRGRGAINIILIGEAAHGASGKGINISNDILKIISLINKMSKKTHPKLRDNFQYIRKIQCISESFSIPEKAIIELNRNLILNETIKGLIEEIKENIKKIDIKSKVIVEEIPRQTDAPLAYIIDENLPQVTFLKNVLEKKYKKIDINYGRSVADENRFSLVLPTICYGPTGKNAHHFDEWVDKKSFLNLCDDYLLILKEFDK